MFVGIIFGKFSRDFTRPLWSLKGLKGLLHTLNAIVSPTIARHGNSGSRVRFVSIRPTRVHNRVQHELDPIINRVEFLNSNMTLFSTELPEHNPSNLL
jgi:hypothetical protein